jgi:hypothetical protein
MGAGYPGSLPIPLLSDTKCKSILTGLETQLSEIYACATLELISIDKPKITIQLAVLLAGCLGITVPELYPVLASE